MHAVVCVCTLYVYMHVCVCTCMRVCVCVCNVGLACFYVFVIWIACQQIREIINARKTSHKHNKGQSCPQQLSPGVQANTRHINSTRGKSSERLPPSGIYSLHFRHTRRHRCVHAGIRQNQFLSQTGHSHLISKLAQHAYGHRYCRFLFEVSQRGNIPLLLIIFLCSTQISFFLFFFFFSFFIHQRAVPRVTIFIGYLLSTWVLWFCASHWFVSVGQWFLYRLILTLTEVWTDHHFRSNGALSSLFFRFLLGVTFSTHTEKAALAFTNGSYIHV